MIKQRSRRRDVLNNPIDMYLTIREAASFFDVSDETIRRWIRQGRIPARRSGDGYILSRMELERWARAHHMGVNKPGEPHGEEGRSTPPDLAAVLRRGGVCFDVPGEDVEGAIRSAVSLMPIPEGISREDILDRMLKREALASTGIGKGVAIPHPRSPVTGPPFDPLITTCFLKNPIDFNAIDGIPVFVLFMILSHTIRQHLEILSQISFRLQDDKFIDSLRKCRSEESFYRQVAGQ